MKTKDFLNHHQSNYNVLLGNIFLDACFYYNVLKILYEAPISSIEFDMLVKEKTKDFHEIKEALHLFEHSVTN